MIRAKYPSLFDVMRDRHGITGRVESATTFASAFGLGAALRGPCRRDRSYREAPPRVGCSSLRVLKQPEDVPVEVGDGGHQATAPDVAGRILQGGASGGHLGQLCLDVGHVPVGHR
jgi:hypothetical protein